ncbi:GntR family transcriptional regulator [Bosea sp. (in: a-proteobacteria)]|uniref:GntR family transcriptional regulator n=1 Tax=Bosea sp. (in: a-proteobacteria) TaxID=1871050 RepID=UPI00261B3E62|nr:GntR family transcriptional regulator [Bosea sp. (in: a-proteobacteria)]MCO5089651.1 GntR family transcriptional regulator [Bosea sp. (in: a-proteobacteria)]
MSSVTEPQGEKGIGQETPKPRHGPSSPDLIYNRIVQGLYQGRYVPGQRLSEPAIMSEYGTSRSSVREALRRLAGEGIVSLNLYRGAYIRALSREEAIDTLLLLEMLVGLSARLAAERIGIGDNRERFNATVQQLVGFEKGGEFLQFVRARNRFYKTLTDIANNREIDRVLPSMQVHLVRIQFRDSDDNLEKVRFDDYRDIAEAVLAGEPNWAEKMARQHVAHVRRSIEHLPDSAFIASEPK